MTPPAPDLSGLKIDRDAAPSRSRWPWAVGLVALALAAAVGILRPWDGPVEVQVIRVAASGGQATGGGLTANGYVVARTKASISTKVMGRLEFIGVSEGSRVRRGDVVARLENDDLRAAVALREAEHKAVQAAEAEARAEVERLARERQRYTELRSRDLVAPRDLEEIQARDDGARARLTAAEARGEAAEAAVRLARVQLAYSEIRAPFDGTVLRKDAEVGEVVAPAATGMGLTRGAVLTMADLGSLEVEVDVNETYIRRVVEGRPAQIVLDAYPGERFAGEVRQVVPTANRQRATVQVKVGFVEADPRILPEMSARVDFELPSEPGGPSVIFVPAEAVERREGADVVWVLADGRLESRPVEAGPVSAGKREIYRGLRSGERIVVSETTALEHGDAAAVRGES